MANDHFDLKVKNMARKSIATLTGFAGWNREDMKESFDVGTILQVLQQRLELLCNAEQIRMKIELIKNGKWLERGQALHQDEIEACWKWAEDLAGYTRQDLTL